MSDKLNNRIHDLDADNAKLRKVNREQLSRLQTMYAKEAHSTTELKKLRSEVTTLRAELEKLKS